MEDGDVLWSILFKTLVSPECLHVCYLNNHLHDNLCNTYRFIKKIDIDLKTKVIEKKIKI